MREHAFLRRLREVDPILRTGRVRRILPTAIEADGPALPLGGLCTIAARDGTLHAEVVAVDQDRIMLAPLEGSARISAGALVTACEDVITVPVGDAFLGRAVDALGRSLDGSTIRSQARAPLHQPAPGPLARAPSLDVLETGVRAIDGLLALGRGQRIGVFAAAGAGKTSLLTQLARQTRADRCVVCLVGERGREVESFWSTALDDEARSRTVLVAATSDETAAMRVRAADHALALAGYWRDQGHQVLLLLDSVTRLAMAMREMGLAAGEPPTVRAYTPGVFARIPRLVERCGALRAGGSISAVMTVLAETDDIEDPVSEMMKSLLDGHILLSRRLAEAGHFPAIDVPASLSRQSEGLVNRDDRALATAARHMLSLYDASRTLIESGLYVAGSNAEIDRAITLRPALMALLAQDERRFVPRAEALRQFAHALGSRA